MKPSRFTRQRRAALRHMDALAYRVEDLQVLLCFELQRLAGAGNALRMLDLMRLAQEAYSCAGDDLAQLYDDELAAQRAKRSRRDQ